MNGKRQNQERTARPFVGQSGSGRPWTRTLGKGLGGTALLAWSWFLVATWSQRGGNLAGDGATLCLWAIVHAGLLSTALSLFLISSDWWRRTSEPVFWRGRETGGRETGERETGERETGERETGERTLGKGGMPETQEFARPTSSVQDRELGRRMSDEFRASRDLANAIAFIALIQIGIGTWIGHFPPSFPQTQFRALIWFHITLALCLVVGASLLLLRRSPAVVGLNWPRLVLLGLILGQLALGFANWVLKFGFPQTFSGIGWVDRYTVVRPSSLQWLILGFHYACSHLIFSQALACGLKFWRVERLARCFFS